MKQTALEPNLLVCWTCIAVHPNWQDNTFEFTLTERNSETLVQFVQEYVQELSDETYGTYNFGPSGFSVGRGRALRSENRSPS